MSHRGVNPNALQPVYAERDTSLVPRSNQPRNGSRVCPAWFQRELKIINRDLECRWGYPECGIFNVWVIVQKITDHPQIDEAAFSKDADFDERRATWNLEKRHVVMELREPFWAECGARITGLGAQCECGAKGKPMEPSSWHLRLVKAGDTRDIDVAKAIMALALMEEYRRTRGEISQAEDNIYHAKSFWWQACGHPRLGSTRAFSAGHEKVFAI